MEKTINYENIWVRNIIFGGILIGISFYQSKISPPTPGRPIETDFQLLSGLLLLFLGLFIFNHFAVRKLLFTKKYGLFFLMALAYSFVITVISMYIDNIIFGASAVKYPFLAQYVSSVLILFIGVTIYLTHNWILNNIIKTKKTLFNREAELTFLKQQLSPHFLFNAINNLYGTALAAPEIITDKILELSDLLRYQVESTNKNDVTIEEERAFVENYINYTTYKSNDLVVTNETVGEAKSFKLPPLLFLPLLENAIKYSSETENAFIHILWQFDRKNMIFSIENSYLMEGSKIKGTKVGLDNLKKRLELLNIKHTLKTDLGTANVYKIELRLWDMSINA
jgi:two-component system, LytTR family, sensor kinase